MNHYPAPGMIVCVGTNIVGRVINTVGPYTVGIVFSDGYLMNAHISVLEPHEGPIMPRPKLTDEEKAANKAAREAVKKGAAPTPAKAGKSKLFEAARFCAPGYKETGEAYSVHASIYGGWLTTYNGIIQYGHPIEEPLQCFPHFGQLMSALKSTEGTAASITQIDAARLSIKSGKFRAVVDCVTDPAIVTRHAPDAQAGALDSRMRSGFEVMKQVASKTGEHVVTASALVRHNSMVATDRHMIVEYWHGLPFPTLTVPADFIEAVLKVPKALVSFGFSERSLTFYFDDWSFIRTQLYAEEWPDVDRVLPTDFSRMQQIPDGFFEALAKIVPFCKRDFILFDDSVMRTNEEADTGCVIEVPGLIEAANGVDVHRLTKLAGRASHIDVVSDPDRVIFSGEAMRGAVACFMFEHTVERSTLPAEHPAPPMPPPGSIPAPPPPPLAPPGTPDAGQPLPLPPPPPLAYAGEPIVPLNPGVAFMPDPAATWEPPAPVIEDDDGDPIYVPPASPSGFGPPQR